MAKAKAITIIVEDRPGTVVAAIAALAEANINILSAFGWSPQGVLQLVVDNPRRAATALARRGIGMTTSDAQVAELQNRPGALHEFLSGLAKKNVNLRSLNAVSSKTGRKAYVVWTAG